MLSSSITFLNTLGENSCSLRPEQEESEKYLSGWLVPWLGEVSELHSQTLKYKNMRSTEMSWHWSPQSPQKLLQLLTPWTSSFYFLCCCYRVYLKVKLTTFCFPSYPDWGARSLAHFLPAAFRVFLVLMWQPFLNRYFTPSYPLNLAGSVQLQNGFPEVRQAHSHPDNTGSLLNNNFSITDIQ